MSKFRKQILHVLVKRVIRIMCANTCTKYVYICQSYSGERVGFFPDTCIVELVGLCLAGASIPMGQGGHVPPNIWTGGT